MITTLENIISEEETATILDVAKNMDIWDNVNQSEFWSNRSTDPHKLKNYVPEVNDLIIKIQRRVMKHIENFYKVKVEDPGATVVRWFPGNSQTPHADNSVYTHMNIGSVIYLNDNYEGGELYFPQHNLDIKPVARNGYVFPGDEFYMHGVREVKSGIRYTLPIFWTVSYYD